MKLKTIFNFNNFSSSVLIVKKAILLNVRCTLSWKVMSLTTVTFEIVNYDECHW